MVGGGGWWSCLSCARGWMGVWGGLVNPALEDAKRKTSQPNATSFCTKMKSGREYGRGGRTGFRARDMTNQPLRVSPFLSHYYYNPPSRLVRGRREEQGKGSTGDVGWHIRNLLELGIWAGPWRGFTELLILQSFKIWVSHTQKMTSVWGRGMFSPAPACKTNRKTGWVCEITAVNCLNKDSCTEVCSGNSSICCLFTRDCPGQVLILTAYVF